MSKSEDKHGKMKAWLAKKKHPILILLFILLNVGVIVITAGVEFGNSQNAANFSEVEINWWLLLPAVICFVVALVCEIYKYVVMMKESTKDAAKFDRGRACRVASRTVLLGKYYDNITPAAVGGQPFQIYYMRKNSELSNGASTSIPIFGMISGQIGFLTIAIICFVFGAGAINNAVLLTTAWFGLIFYAFWPVMVAGINFFPKQTTAFIEWVIKILAKMKIIKNRQEALEKTEFEVKEYQKSIKMILKTKGLFLKTVLLSVGFNGLVALIPFFVLSAFGGGVEFWTCFATTVAVMAAVYFIPTPGNAGVAEGTFFLVFSGLSTGYVFWAMLTWRFFSYYIYIMLGLLIYAKMHFEKKTEESG